MGAGECWSIIGRNGAGKSTLIRTLAGLRAPDSGAVSLNGSPLADWPLDDLARTRAFLAQSRSDAFGYSAIDTVLAQAVPEPGAVALASVLTVSRWILLALSLMAGAAAAGEWLPWYCRCQGVGGRLGLSPLAPVWLILSRLSRLSLLGLFGDF